MHFTFHSLLSTFEPFSSTLQTNWYIQFANTIQDIDFLACSLKVLVDNNILMNQSVCILAYMCTILLDTVQCIPSLFFNMFNIWVYMYQHKQTDHSLLLSTEIHISPIIQYEDKCIKVLVSYRHHFYQGIISCKLSV